MSKRRKLPPIEGHTIDVHRPHGGDDWGTYSIAAIKTDSRVTQYGETVVRMQFRLQDYKDFDPTIYVVSETAAIVLADALTASKPSSRLFQNPPKENDE